MVCIIADFRISGNRENGLPAEIFSISFWTELFQNVLLIGKKQHLRSVPRESFSGRKKSKKAKFPCPPP